MNVEAEVRERLEAVRERIERAAKRAQRDPREITLVAVAKRQPAERVAAAARGGVSDVAENYVQEARVKIPKVRVLLEGLPQASLRWHLVGRLQRNKAREALRWFDQIHSLDRLELGLELNRRAAAAGGAVDVLAQVNLSGEPQKGGVSPEGLRDLLERCTGLSHLRLVGLMTMPPLSPTPEASRPLFARLRALRDALRPVAGDAFRELSMGMSDDFEVAIEEGATMVRIGTAVFGPRESAP